MNDPGIRLPLMRVPTAAAPEVTIAVVIPVFNQTDYLKRAISSVAWQLAARDEIIVVDDASTDLRGFEIPDWFRRRLLWLRNSTQLGVAQSRNLAIDRSQAVWIKFLDADDVLAPFALQVLRQAAAGLPEQVKIFTGGCHRVYNGCYCDYLCGAAESLPNIMKANPILPSATFVKRDALIAVGGFDQRIDFEEDWDLWLKLHEKFGPGAFAVTDKPICYYWINTMERALKPRKYTVDGVPVREYFRARYGAEPPALEET